MAPDGAVLVTDARHSPGVSSQVGTQPSPTRVLFAFTHVVGTGRSGPGAACPMGVALVVSAGDEVSASLLAGCATASDMGLCQRTGCLPRLRRGLSPSVAHGRDIDNFLSIGQSQAPNGSLRDRTHKPPQWLTTGIGNFMSRHDPTRPLQRRHQRGDEDEKFRAASISLQPRVGQPPMALRLPTPHDHNVRAPGLDSPRTDNPELS
jgi:hypothetical protein